MNQIIKIIYTNNQSKISLKKDFLNSINPCIILLKQIIKIIKILKIIVIIIKICQTNSFINQILTKLITVPSESKKKNLNTHKNLF